MKQFLFLSVTLQLFVQHSLSSDQFLHPSACLSLYKKCCCIMTSAQKTLLLPLMGSKACLFYENYAFKVESFWGKDDSD